MTCQGVVEVLADASATQRVLEAVAERVKYPCLVGQTNAADVAPKPFRPALCVATPWASREKRKEWRCLPAAGMALADHIQKTELYEFRVQGDHSSGGSRLEPCSPCLILRDGDEPDAGLL